MRDQHPIDDLFARALRDAEADPSAAVWKGIARERNWAHQTLQRLRRRWGSLLLLLFLSGAVGYAGLFTGPTSERTTHVAISVNGKQGQPAHEGGPSLATYPPLVNGPTGSNAASAALISGRSANEATFLFTGSPTRDAHSVLDVELGASEMSEEVTWTPSEQPTGSFTHATPSKSGRFGSMLVDIPVPVEVRLTTATVALSGNETDASTPRKLTIPSSETGNDGVGAEVSIAQDDLLTRIPARPSLHNREAFGLEIETGYAPSGVGPHRVWWIAATLGQFRETRSWKNADDALVRALESTEGPHVVTALGFLVGSEWRGGWNFAVGMEHAAARYDFSHLDHFRSRSDSIVSMVITFNAQVVDSFTDTVTTYSEIRDRVVAVNRYSTIRVPVEVGWHKPFRRFHFGVRGGLAMEFNSMLSGVTLTNSDEGTRSVDASTVRKGSTVLVAGGLAVDLGYAITERWSLWASPSYGAGLFPLSTTKNLPYAVPERLGVRMRLAYSLRPNR